jgi:hypothetical protein
VTLVLKVYEVIKKVLDSDRLAYMPGAANTLQAATSNLSLFEHMTANDSPEIRAQEALLPHLVAAGFHVDRELKMTIGETGRVFDFVVREAAPSADMARRLTDATACVIIELKHMSPHQTGQFGHLLGPVLNQKGEALQSLHEDFTKPRPTAASFIQLGLYTAVEGWHKAGVPSGLRDDTRCPFIRKYVRRPLSLSSYDGPARQALADWPIRPRYTCPVHPATADDFCVGPEAQYVTSANVTVTGRVNYFMGIVA